MAVEDALGVNIFLPKYSVFALLNSKEIKQKKKKTIEYIIVNKNK